MATNVKPIPDGYHTLTPDLIVKDVAKAIDFYVKAFNAREVFRMDGPDGKVMHAEVQIGDSRLMLCSECTERGNYAPSSLHGNTGSLILYVKDVDSAFKQALNAGGKSLQGIEEMFWGDRAGLLVDPWGQHWMLATHTRNLTQEQIKQGAEAFFAAMAKK